MSALGKIIPLLILFAVLGGGAYFAYQIYLWSNEMTARGRAQMEKKNMSFTKEGGLRVGVKEVKDEKYLDSTQNVLVNVWNSASLPNYKSSLGWNSTQARPEAGRHHSSFSGKSSSDTRPSASRESSHSSSRPSASRTTSSAVAGNLSPPAPRSSSKRSASPVPGGWE